MNDLCADIGYKSVNHYGEELCGDHVDVVEQDENSTVIVLADGLGSGVKASILSTLTSKIISTMMAEGLPLEECVSTIAATLPVCSVRGVADSTFTIIHLKNNDIAEVIQYDNPQVIIIRDREYNLASRCLGTPITRIATKNILPFMTSVIVTLAATEIPSYISYEVFLSYIGMGLSDMSLGKIIEAAQGAMVTPGWEFEFWCPVALASIITVVLYVVGQNLGDASDPRTHM